jgi:hypothetical protein
MQHLPPFSFPADMLAQLRSAQEEAARLKKELAVVQQQQPVSRQCYAAP